MCDMSCERTQLQDNTPKVSDTVKVRKQWKQSQNTINKVATQQKWFSLTKIDINAVANIMTFALCHIKGEPHSLKF